VRVGDCDVAAETSSSTKNAFASPKSRNKEKWLYGIYRMGRDSIDKGKNEPPYAFIIPADQRGFLPIVFTPECYLSATLCRAVRHAGGAAK